MKKEVKPVDVNNDAMMVAEGIRNPFVRKRDQSVWSKSDKERKAWKKRRHFPVPDTRWSPPTKYTGFTGKLIVNVRGLEKTTFSHTCLETDIQYLLSKYKSDKCAIVRAFWNGREINPEGLLQQAV